MEVTELLVQKFFDRKCTADEAKAVSAYLSRHPQTVATLFSDEWESLDNHVHEILLDHESVNMYAAVETVMEKSVNRFKVLRMVASLAACVAGVVALFWMLSGNNKNAEMAKVNIKQEIPFSVRVNTTNEIVKVYLQDSSEIRMQPAAVIKYKPTFENCTTRDVYLQGEAFFHETHNATKPFTVYAGDIATTAIGTQFSVADNTKEVVVKLYEGKVKIRPSVEISSWKKDVYLLPGQEFRFNKTEHTFKVQAFSLNESNNINEHRSKNSANGTITKTPDWYMFNNQNMQQVFSALEELYNVHIVYNEDDMQHVYFIGKFEKSDSVENILKNIALLKHLRVSKDGNTFTIQK